jgi:uncharacterized iron-regulated protein
MSSRSSRPSRFSLLLVLWLVAASLGCASEQRTVSSSSPKEAWQAWDVLETKTGQVMDYSEWLKSLEHNQVIYLGEEHYNPHHIEAAVRLLSAFVSDGLRPVIGMEMFGWDGQEALDQYLSSQTMDKTTFLQASKWTSNWGGAYENYEPLVLFAKDRHIALRAMNPPKTLIRQIVKQGLVNAQAGEEWRRWGMAPEDIIDDPPYRAKILDQLRRCHGGGAEEDYRTMYEASMVRDEGMAQTIVASVEGIRREQPAERTVVLSYTGGGHIQYNLPVPSRVARRLSRPMRQTTIYLASFDQTRTSDIGELMQERIADFIWLTPMAGHGPVQRCR